MRYIFPGSGDWDMDIVVGMGRYSARHEGPGTVGTV